MQESKIKITTLGAAVQDVVLEGDVLTAKRDGATHDSVEQFPLGEKLELEKVTFGTGGGATNAAMTFVKHGFEVALLGKVGDDPAAATVLKLLSQEGIDTSGVVQDSELTTGYSTLLLAPSGERTVLVYRGASEALTVSDFDFDALQTDWLYITSLGGNLDLLEKAVKSCLQKGVKVALDPGSAELDQAERLRGVIKGITLIKGNREELGRLFEAEEPPEILQRGAGSAQYIVVTDGPKGSWATDGSKIYQAGMYEDVPVRDRTGAGDAFGAGIVAELARGAGVEAALTFGSANSTSVVQQVGAKVGLLEAGAELKPMSITVSDL